MATIDPEKRRARSRRYWLKLKIAKYGPESAGQCMIGKHGNHAKGPANGRWNNGRMRTSQGYVAIKVPDGHHLRQAHGYAYEHDMVAESMLGRSLLPGEVVHHKNGVRDDNRPENLEVTTRSEHAKQHSEVPGARDAKGRFAPGVRPSDPSEWPDDLRVRELGRSHE